LTGAAVTLKISIGGLAITGVFEGSLASIRFLIANRLVQFLITSYVEVLRNIPSLTQLLVIYFGLAYIGIRLNSLMAAIIIGLGLIGAAVQADVFRAGLQAGPQGQHEAALAIGLTPLRTFTLIIVPQAWRNSLPPLGSYAIGLVKDTSLAAIAAPEIMFNARTIVSQTFATSTVYALASLIYLAITVGLGCLVTRLEFRTQNDLTLLLELL
jgi:polar amino acid transport system permease protein